ncbi:interferon-related developmental regulator-domain-containing protein [Dichotomocladium elegans]|nr:interferon-related developmental regulator-domain-containing protein [Dichotomocladium elegans]
MARNHRSGGSDKETLSGPAWVNKLNGAIDDLAVNRASIRQEAIATVISILTNHYAAEALEPRIEELTALLRRSLSKAVDPKESSLAAHAIALVFITHNSDLDFGDQDELYQSFLPTFKAAIKSNDSILTKIQCLHTLALITMIAGSEIDTHICRDLVFDLIESEGQGFNTDDFSSHQLDQLASGALRAYGILFVSSFYDHGVTLETLVDEIEKVMPMHEILLGSSDKSVRIAAGENIALIFELLSKVNNQDENDDEEEEHFEYDNMNDLVRTLKDLSVESSRRQSKDDRAEQKSVFRTIAKSVAEGMTPIEELKISGRVITFKGWSKILLLNAFRQAIGQGLQHHLQTNDLLRQIFRYSSSFIISSPAVQDDSDVEDAPKLSKPDRQFAYDESKKMRSKKFRDIRNNRKH